MKKCPFCKADIEENARFCLYCMKTLNEKEIVQSRKKKNRWWLSVPVGLLVVALLTGAFLVLRQPPEPLAQTSEGESKADHQVTDVPTDEPTAAIEETALEETEVPETQPEEPEMQLQEPETQPQEASATEAVYTYRTAQAGDEFNANYTNTEGDIVITGIAQPSENGIYDIPSYIEGKRVIAIVANAFTGSNATTVYLPDTVKAIRNYAFAGCPVTDVYFTHNVYIEALAFSSSEGILTIHCPTDCHNRAFSYYSSSMGGDFSYEEWNG